MVTDWKYEIFEEKSYLNVFISWDKFQAGEQYHYKVAVHFPTYK